METLWDSALVRVLVTLVVPVAWGLLTAWLFDVWRARYQRRARAAASADSSTNGQSKP